MTVLSACGAERPEGDVLAVSGGAVSGEAKPSGRPETTAREVLAAVRDALAERGAGRVPPARARRLELAGLDPAALTLVAEILGVGDIAGTVTDGAGGVVRLQESVLPGVWRLDTAGALAVEIADCPAVVRAAMAAAPAGLPDWVAQDPAGGTGADDAAMGRVLLRELAAHSLRVLADPQTASAVLPLTRHPLGPSDAALLHRILGEGAVSLMVRGASPCRLYATAQRPIWRVDYLLADGGIFMTTLEVGDVPAAFRATADDMTDAAHHLEILLASALP